MENENTNSRVQSLHLYSPMNPERVAQIIGDARSSMIAIDNLDDVEAHVAAQHADQVHQKKRAAHNQRLAHEENDWY